MNLNKYLSYVIFCYCISYLVSVFVFSYLQDTFICVPFNRTGMTCICGLSKQLITDIHLLSVSPIMGGPKLAISPFCSPACNSNYWQCMQVASHFGHKCLLHGQFLLHTNLNFLVEELHHCVRVEEGLCLLVEEALVGRAAAFRNKQELVLIARRGVQFNLSW